MRFILVFCMMFGSVLINQLTAKTYNIADSGAINDGKTINTQVIQSTIDQCSNDGGGIILFSGGGRICLRYDLLER